MPRHSRQSETAVRAYLRENDHQLYGYGMSRAAAARAVEMHTGIRVTPRYLRTLQALEPALRWRGFGGSVPQGDKPLSGREWSSLCLWINHHATDDELELRPGTETSLCRRVVAAGIGVRPSIGNIREAMRIVRNRRSRDRSAEPRTTESPRDHPPRNVRASAMTAPTRGVDFYTREP